MAQVWHRNKAVEDWNWVKLETSGDFRETLSIRFRHRKAL